MHSLLFRFFGISCHQLFLCRIHKLDIEASSLLFLQLTLNVKQTSTHTHKKEGRQREGERKVDGVYEYAKKPIRTIAFTHTQQLD